MVYETPRSIGQVAKALSDAFHDFAHYNKPDPVDELVFILLSLLTQESVYLRVYYRLCCRFPDWSNLDLVDVSELEDLLGEGGLARQKARHLQAIARRLKQDFGCVSLDHLDELDDETCEAYLRQLPGIGTKAARCVMLYSLGRQVFPVDTHCWRVARRLGWITTETNEPTSAWSAQLESLIPPEHRFSLHVNFVSLGRQICVPGRPACERCPIRPWCPTGSG